MDVLNLSFYQILLYRKLSKPFNSDDTNLNAYSSYMQCNNCQKQYNLYVKNLKYQSYLLLVLYFIHIKNDYIILNISTYW